MLVKNPLIVFNRWLREALVAEKSVEPNMFCLSTQGLDGFPNSRYVLLKEVFDGKFVFFTNYDSAKGREIARHNKVAMNFIWPTFHRQVRVQGTLPITLTQGTVTQLDGSKSDDYFLQRPLKSQIEAICSPQSQPIAMDKSDLKERVEVLTKNLEQGKAKIQRPPHWGGYVIAPLKMEFWQGDANRNHDRFLFSLEDGLWKVCRLAP